ncbi:hypothetical protein [Pseudomonas sp. CCOS 191]|uniref:hypothetical protein n=1 Tax=Pseudomonas sp. CCOS 191 TaxID=1649877 RepID=UPI000624E817|nr:hypothetical protein [Pseudomonas sp. CCOS 191]CRI58843.1 hypothetical protein CCOS191_4307 [Pseudomonas sp. CCOS 191]
MNKPVSAQGSKQLFQSSKALPKRSTAVYHRGVFLVDAYHPLEVASLIPEDPDAAPGTPGVVLPVTAQGTNLATAVLIWENALAGQTIALMLDGELLLEDDEEDIAWHDVLPVEAEDSTFKFQLSVPVKYLNAIPPGTEKTVMLGYSVRQVGSDDWSDGPVRPVRIDKHAPGGSEGTLAKIKFSDAIEAKGYILQQDFVAGVLEATVPGYTEQRQYDAIVVTITDGTNTSPPQSAKVVSSSDATVVQLPLAAFATLADEVAITFSYIVTDRAGNSSVTSVSHDTLKLLLKDIPVTLDKLKVPKFGDEEATPQVLLDKDAWAGVKVVIPEITGIHANDKIVVLWEGKPSDEHTVPFPPPSGDLMEITLLYALTSGGPENDAVKVDYQLWRADSKIAETTTPNVVNVDLRLPGGPDPDPEIPGHGKLKQATIKGNASNQIDDLTPEDVEQGAVLTIPWTDQDGNDLLQTGDALQFVWGDEVDDDNNFRNVFALDSVSEDEANAAADITRDVLPESLETQPSGEVPMTITVTRQFNPDPDADNNPAFAPFKPVKVVRPGDLPGDGAELDFLEFTRLNSQLNIDRTVAKNGLPISIRLFSGAKQGDTIQIHLKADDGTKDVPGNPIEAATQNLPVRELSSDDVILGQITATIDEEWAYRVCLGTATVEYTADNSIGTKRSGHARIFVAIRKPSEPSCPFPELRSSARKRR